MINGGTEMETMELYLTAPKPWIDQIISVAKEQKRAEILSRELDDILDTAEEWGD
jgi:hypothetical protein